MFLGFRTTICNLIIVNAVFTPCLAASEEIKNDTSVAEALFKRLYKLERTEQLAAVKALLKLDKPDRKKKMLEAIAAKVLYVIEGSKLILDDEKFIPGVTAFPGDERVRDALSNVLENTAFLADIIVRLPSMSQKVLEQKSEWLDLLRWSIGFTNQSRLIDGKTTKLLDLVNKEMNFTVRNSDFINPFNKEKLAPIPVEDEDKKKKTKKKKNIPKGPRLSSRQSGDL